MNRHATAGATSDVALAGKHVVVTGANGFVGSFAARRLLAARADVTAIVRPTADLWRLRDLKRRLRVLPATLEELPTPRVVDALRGADVLIHLASGGSNPPPWDPLDLAFTNVAGLLQVLTLAERAEIRRTVSTGTAHEYGEGSKLSEDQLPRPVDLYGASKAAGWMLSHTLAQSRGLDLVTLRCFHLYGGGQARHFIVPYATLQALASRPIALTSGHQVRDYVYVEDAVDGMLAAATAPDVGGHTFNLSSGREITIADLIRTLVRASGGGSQLRLGELPPRPRELTSCTGDPSRAMKYLGWAASTPLEDGLRMTVEWFRAHRVEYERHYPPP